MTHYRGPLDARVYQDTTAREFDAPVIFGWTTAARHGECARMYERTSLGDGRHSDIVMATLLWPLQEYLNTFFDSDDERTPWPACFNERGKWIARLRLDAAARSVTVETPCTQEHVIAFESEPVPDNAALKFFMAVPARPFPGRNWARSVPDVYLGNSQFETA